jgi:hypothetical protein
MDEDEEERRGFRVTDRRRFAESGEARPEAPERPEQPAAGPQPGHAASRSATADRPATSGEEAARPPAGSPAMDEPVSFSTFVLGLSTQALLHLGEIANPLTQVVERDLGAAKHVIDILGILREKTRNNLEAGEESLLDSILYDLRMRYVELMRSGPKEGR